MYVIGRREISDLGVFFIFVGRILFHEMSAFVFWAQKKLKNAARVFVIFYVREFS
jgi:hypothetical protein